jgi:hypothetical protein
MKRVFGEINIFKNILDMAVFVNKIIWTPKVGTKFWPLLHRK